jgi:hypothetical protein
MNSTCSRKVVLLIIKLVHRFHTKCATTTFVSCSSLILLLALDSDKVTPVGIYLLSRQSFLSSEVGSLRLRASWVSSLTKKAAERGIGEIAEFRTKNDRHLFRNMTVVSALLDRSIYLLRLYLVNRYREVGSLLPARRSRMNEYYKYADIQYTIQASAIYMSTWYLHV